MTGEQAPQSGLYAPPREEWLALRQEPILEPELPIIDAHHHLWMRGGSRYLFEELLADLKSGHRIVGTVFMECRSMYRASGADHLKPAGEVEYVNGVAAMAQSGVFGSSAVCAGIVGYADLTQGDLVQPALESLKQASSRFRGIRQVSAWDADTTFHHPAVNRPPGLLLDPSFRTGFSRLAPLGLSFDAFLFHTQIAELTDLARQFPETQIVLDHLGAPLGVGTYAGQRDEIFFEWKKKISRLAKCPNVAVKIGGLGMRSAGFAFDALALPPSSDDLASAWRPYVETVIEAFGPGRAMLESNFPPDKASCSYPVLWNAFKRLTSAFSFREREDLFAGTAARIYRLDYDRKMGRIFS